MLYNFLISDSSKVLRYFIFILIILIYTFIKTFFVLFFRVNKDKKNTKKYTKYKKLARNIDYYFIIVVFVSLYVIVVYNVRYYTKDVFAWNKEYNSKDFSSTFQTFENPKPKDMEANLRILHYDWFETVFAENKSRQIDQETIEQYKAFTKNMLTISPFDSDRITDAETSSAYENLKETFCNYVQKDPADLSYIDCWEGYNAGCEVIKKEYTSEFVFQTAVLAENAHSKSSNEPALYSQSMTYAAGAVEKFEAFLKFRVRYAGKEDPVEPKEIAFRIGKMLYRQARITPNDQDSIALHLTLKTYSYFNYAIDNLSSDNEVYLLYLYYNSLAVIDMNKYIKDDDLRHELRDEQLRLWEDLGEIDEQYFIEHPVEGHTLDSIRKLKDILASL